MASARKLLVDAFEERNKQMERKAAQEYQQQQQLAVMGRLLEMKRERLQRLEAEYEKVRTDHLFQMNSDDRNRQFV